EQFHLAAEDPPLGVDLFEGELAADQLVLADSGVGSGQRVVETDLDRLFGAGLDDERPGQLQCAGRCRILDDRTPTQLPGDILIRHRTPPLGSIPVPARSSCDRRTRAFPCRNACGYLFKPCAAFRFSFLADAPRGSATFPDGARISCRRLPALHRTRDICSSAIAFSGTATQPQTRHYSGRNPVGQSRVSGQYILHWLDWWRNCTGERRRLVFCPGIGVVRLKWAWKCLGLRRRRLAYRAGLAVGDEATRAGAHF